MSALSLSCVLLFLTLQATSVYCQGQIKPTIHCLLLCQLTGHQHAEYASQQQMNQMKTELNGKIAAVKNEMEEEKVTMENENSFWRSALVSMLDMLHRATSGKTKSCML